MKRFLIPALSLVACVGFLVACETNPEPKTYTVTFQQTGQEDVVRTVNEGDDLAESSIPTPAPKTGYTVTWEAFDSTDITGNIVVKALETANTYTITYSVEADEGESLNGAATQEVTYDEAYTLTTTPIKEMYIGSWMNGSNAIANSGTWTIASDVTLTPHWVENTWTISFVQDGQTTINEKVEKGGTLAADKIPTPAPKTGYDVTWETTTFENVTSNMTVNVIETAKKYTVTYQLGAGESLPTGTETTLQVSYNGSYTLATPTKENYKFVQWKDGATPVATSGTWTKDGGATLTAQFEALDECTVIFTNADGTQAKSITVYEGQNIAAADFPTPKAKDGYTIDGWKLNGEKVTEITNVTTDLTLVANANANTYTVTYNTNGGELPAGTESTLQVTYDSAYTLATPTKYGYTFSGWKNGETAVSSEKWNIASNVTLTASWTDNFYTISFYDADGQLLTNGEVKVENGTTIRTADIPALPTATGYTYTWDKDPATLTASGSVHAVENANSYTITYEANGGTLSGSQNTVSVKYGEAFDHIADPSRNGYEFLGWYIKGTNTKVEDTAVYSQAKDITLEAKWEKENWTKNY
ncbi:MAG: InlB B-repeat-containing protein [Clostridia bacterium]|nr:InlB B-repeat-containing protein [Clostridia bacterium]